jgi:hypothetical protein
MTIRCLALVSLFLVACGGADVAWEPPPGTPQAVPVEGPNEGDELDEEGDDEPEEPAPAKPK